MNTAKQEKVDGGAGNRNDYVLRSLDLGQTTVLRAEKKAVHVGEFYLVVIKKDKLANSASCEHLCGDGANTSHANDKHTDVANVL